MGLSDRLRKFCDVRSKMSGMDDHIVGLQLGTPYQATLLQSDIEKAAHAIEAMQWQPIAGIPDEYKYGRQLLFVYEIDGSHIYALNTYTPHGWVTYDRTFGANPVGYMQPLPPPP